MIRVAIGPLQKTAVPIVAITIAPVNPNPTKKLSAESAIRKPKKPTAASRLSSRWRRLSTTRTRIRTEPMMNETRDPIHTNVMTRS